MGPIESDHTGSGEPRSGDIRSCDNGDASLTQHTKQRCSLTKSINIDSIVVILQKTIFNPSVMWLPPACMLAGNISSKSLIFILAVFYYGVLLIMPYLYRFNNTIAYGPPRSFDPAQEVVVIAGGASGIGSAIARKYISRGVKVALLDIQDFPPDLTSILGKNARVYRCDATDLSQIEKTAKEIEHDLGSPTVLINSIATAINPHQLLESTPQAIRKTIDANLMTYFNALKIFLPYMISNPDGGHIITMSSVIGWLTAAGLTDYSATKAGMTAAHKALLAELHSSGAIEKIKMVLVEMGQVATPLFEALETPNQFFAPIMEPEYIAEKIVQRIESGRGGLIRVPFYAQFVGLYSVLPGSVQRLARVLSGIDLAVERSRKA